MKKFLFSLIALVATVIGATAQDKPAVTLHTSIYDGYGDSNSFSLVVGGTEAGTIEVDCGYGRVKYDLEQATFNQSTQSLNGTYINCHVNRFGTVRIYCEGSARIEYFNGLGCFIRQIDFEHPEALTVLNLEHNELESLDLSGMTNLQALYLNDNPFNVEPFNISVKMPSLQILDMGIIENISPDFTFRNFPALASVDAMSTHGLLNADTSGCPNLLRLSIDNTNVEKVDVSKNPQLRILNVSDTRVTELDLTKNPNLQQLYATHHAAMNNRYKIHTLSLNKNSELIYLFLTGNALTSLDCSGMSKLRELGASHNRLTSINLDGCTSLATVNISHNCLDFNTLPVNPGYWSEYVGKQSDIAVPRSVAVDQPLDFKAKVIRSDSETSAAVFTVSRETPEKSTRVSDDAFTFADGVIKFNKVIADSVYVEFSNTLFPEFELQTARFKVKSAEDFGKPSMAFFFNPIYLGSGSIVTFGVGIDGATAQTPKTVHVDFGDGELKPFPITAFNGNVSTITATKPSYGAVKVYVEGDDVVTDIVIEDIYSSEVDLSRVDELRHLTLRGLELYDIDLQWNRCLQSLTLTGNHFYRGIDLKGANGWYGKNTLTYLNLSNNELESLEFNDIFMLKHLDLSKNKISEFNFKDADSLEYIDMSHNKLTDLVINYCSALREGYFDHNSITSVRMPEINIVEKFSVNDNKLTLATLPEHGLMTDENYKYAPQAKINIPAKGPGHDLSSQYVVIDGKATVFTWKTTTGETLVEGVDYTIDKGNTTFMSTTNGKMLFCEISHPAFPAFEGANVLKTTNIQSAGIPTNCLAKFVTPVGGETVRLSMTATRPATAVYIDWTGKGELTQYILTDESYTLFEATTTAGAEVKVYSYSNVSNLSVFSVTGAKMESIDASNMTQVVAFSVNSAGLTLDKIVFPNPSGLRELSLVDNNITSFDFAPFTSLESCGLDRNKLKTLDVSKAASSLQVLTVANNSLEEIKFGGNNQLWGLSLSNNKLTEVDFHGVPALYQVFLDNNRFDHIDLDYLKELRVVYLGGNLFTFATLPLPREQWTLYTYSKQAQIKIDNGSIVDLAYLAERDGVATEFRWYHDEPAFDSDLGEYVGDELVEGEDYTIENGVTTFHADIDRVSCLMSNELFPNMFLSTNVIKASKLSGIQPVGANEMQVSVSGFNVSVSGLEEGTPVSLICADGRIAACGKASAGTTTLAAPARGFYVVSTPDAAIKLVVR